MDKIIPTIQAMVKHPQNISDVCTGCENKDEYFFLYNKKYRWSISQSEADGSFNLFYYAAPNMTIEEIASVPSDAQQEYLLWFSSKNFPSKEQQLAFSDLLKIVREKLFNIDAVMEDIIGDDSVPF